VRAQVRLGDGRADVRERGRLARGEVPLVERIETLAGKGLEGRRERRQPDALARSPRSVRGPEDREEPGSRAERRTDERRGPFDAVDEPVPCGEAVAGERDRGSQDPPA
jgi:hypothetical protein